MNMSRPITRDVERVKRFIVDDGHVKSKICNAKKKIIKEFAVR